MSLIYFQDGTEENPFGMLPPLTLAENRIENIHYEEITQIAINRYTLFTNIYYKIYSRRDGAVSISNNYSGNDYISSSDNYSAYYEEKKAGYHNHLLQNNLARYNIPDYRTIWALSVNQYHPAEADRLLYYIENSEQAERKIILDILGLHQDDYSRILKEIKNFRFDDIKRESIERAKTYEKLEPAARVISEYIKKGKDKNKFTKESLKKIIRQINDGKTKPEKILKTVYGDSSVHYFKSESQMISDITELSEHNEGFSFFINHGIEAAEAAKKLADVFSTYSQKTTQLQQINNETVTDISKSLNTEVFNEAAGLFYEKAGRNIENYLKLSQMERIQLKTDFIKFIENDSNNSFVRELVNSIKTDSSLSDEAKAWISFPDAETEYLKEQGSDSVEKQTERIVSKSGEKTVINKASKTENHALELSQWVQYMSQDTWDNTVRLIFKNSQKTEKNYTTSAQLTEANTENTFSYSGYLRDVFHLINTNEQTVSRDYRTVVKTVLKTGAEVIDRNRYIITDNDENIAESLFVYQQPDMVVTPSGVSSGSMMNRQDAGAMIRKAEEAVQMVHEEVTDITKIKKNVTDSSTELMEETIRKLSEQVDMQNRDIRRMEENQNIIIRNTDTTLLTERVLRNLNRQVYFEKLRKGIR